MADPTDDRDRGHWQAVEEASELLQAERVQDALLALRDVIKADPSNPYAFHLLGLALCEMAQLVPARDAYRAAIRLSPEYLGARVALSHVLRALGDPKGALAQAKAALRRFPKDADALHAAGLAYAATGDRPAARRHLEGFLDTHPEAESELEVRQILEMLGIGGDDEPIEFD